MILLLPNPKCVRELLTQRASEMEVAPEELILLKLRSNQVNLLPLDCSAFAMADAPESPISWLKSRFKWVKVRFDCSPFPRASDPISPILLSLRYNSFKVVCSKSFAKCCCSRVADVIILKI